MIQASRQHGPECDAALERGDLDDLCPDCLATACDGWEDDR